MMLCDDVMQLYVRMAELFEIVVSGLSARLSVCVPVSLYVPLGLHRFI